jgi:hypothetical protein
MGRVELLQLPGVCESEVEGKNYFGENLEKTARYVRQS